MIAVYAHGFGGTNGLPLPRWLLAYLIGFAIVLAFIVLRFVRPPHRPVLPVETGAKRRKKPHKRRERAVARVVGLVLFVGTFVAAAFGVDDSGANIATVTVIVLFFLGMQVVSLVFGDVFWWFNPFDTLAGLFLRHDRDRSRRQPSTRRRGRQPRCSLSFIWFVFAYPEFYPPTPHEVAVFLALYTGSVLAGAGVLGTTVGPARRRIRRAVRRDRATRSHGANPVPVPAWRRC